MENWLVCIAAWKAELDQLRIHAPGGPTNFDHYQDIERTYTSNAIEGNTLTAVETTMVIEQGITVAGKPLRDHLEAIGYVRALARRKAPVTEMDERNLHRVVVLRSRADIAGRCANQVRCVRTDSGRHGFPSPAEVPALMGDFAVWLDMAADPPGSAFIASSLCRDTSLQ